MAENLEEDKLPSASEEVVEEHASLPAQNLYEVIVTEGVDELQRPPGSLWWSGVTAGIVISMSVVAEAMLHMTLPAQSWRPLLENFGYSLGFVIVILGGMQLFTENTITVILPLLARFSARLLGLVARLWAIVLTANLAGTLVAALAIYYCGIMKPEIVVASLEISRHVLHKPPVEVFLQAIPAGFLIAALVWISPNSGNNRLLVIVLVTYFVALGGFVHIVAGSTEVFLLVLDGQIVLSKAILGILIPALLGNVVGGTGLFAMLAYGQVRREID